MCWKCIRDYNSSCPYELWPIWISNLIIKKSHLNRSERIRSVCFLYGNGITSKKHIFCILQNKLRDKSAFIHVSSVFNDVQKGTYDSVWTYYNIGEKCLLYMNGEICFEQAQISSYDLKINIWNRYCSKYKTNLSMQMKYFGEDAEVCEKINNSVGNNS